jgi:opacity protein-like surface antigen
MNNACGRLVGVFACALALLAGSGCAWMRHGHKSAPKCHDPPVTGDTRNFPPLRVPAGLDAPDTRNAIKVPPLPETASARLPDEPCLTDPPSFGGPSLAGGPGAANLNSVSRTSWQMNVGAALPMGSTANYLNSGWTLGGGFIFHPKAASRWALQFDLSYADFNASSNLINLGQQKLQYSIDGGSGNVWAMTAAGRYTVPFTGSMNGYGLLGIGGYHESIKLTETALYGGYVCDFWGYCYIVTTTGNSTVASKSLTKFGWNVGVGLEFPVRDNSAWFIETRYQHVQGHNSIVYLPIQIGYRF